MPPLKPSWTQPSHPKILEVVQSSTSDSFTSFSRSNVSAPAGSTIITLSSPPLTLSDKAYSTVQISLKHHVNLNCDFLYLNHSCNPSLELHVIPRTRSDQELLDVEGTARDVPNAIEIRVAERTNDAGKLIGLHIGDEMTFFYPSTEWEMAQPLTAPVGRRIVVERYPARRTCQWKS